ncbi:MAG: hypothetical protein HY340_02130 [Candidatus Kerfeldbacteria bacterium]|nr:hypothetical protein [Candidatus Kerfeldbacteria bacterium]
MTAVTEIEIETTEDRFLDALSAYDRNPTALNRALLKVAAINYQPNAWVKLASERGWFDTIETSDRAA